MSRFFDDLTACFPLIILKILWDETTFTIEGDSWFFSTNSPWRILKGRSVVAGFDDQDAQKAQFLVGNKITRCNSSTDELYLGLRLETEDGYQIEIFSTSDFEPWKLELPSGSVYVATPDI